MTKPTVLPRWATGGGAVIVEPLSGEKDVGWADGDEAASEYFNWLQRYNYEWCKYLNELETYALTWTAMQTFNAGLTARGVSIASGSPGTEGGHFEGGPNTGAGNGGLGAIGYGGASTAASGGVGLWGVAGASAGGFGGTGLLATATGVGHGAYVTGGTGAGNGLTAYAGNTGGYSGSFICGASSKAARFADASSNGRPIVEVAGYVNMDDGYQPATVTGFKNTLTKKNVPKAWVRFTLNSTISPVIESGFNIASVTAATFGSGASFGTALVAGKYSAVGNAYDVPDPDPTILGDLYLVQCKCQTASNVHFDIFKLIAGVWTHIDAGATSDVVVEIHVMGEQT